jgi:hypothetical protein
VLVQELLTQGVGALQAGMQAPNISQFFNPYQQYVTDEIARRGQMQMNQLSAQASRCWCIWWWKRRCSKSRTSKRNFISNRTSSSSRFWTTALLQAAQQQRAQQLAGGQALGQLGAQQQAMSLADIQAQMQAGALQRGIGQQALEAQRQTALQRAYEPYQRIEFLKGIMTNLPTTQSTLTATTAPGSNPLGQAAGTALGGYAAYNMMQPR